MIEAALLREIHQHTSTCMTTSRQGAYRYWRVSLNIQSDPPEPPPDLTTEY